MTESLQNSQEQETHKTETQETNIPNQEKKILGYKVEETRIKTNFTEDKEFPLLKVEEDIKNTTNQDELIKKKEDEITTYIRQQNCRAAIKHLDELQDLRKNITRTEIVAENKDGAHPASVLIRDARNVREGKLGAEAFKMQYLSALRSAQAVHQNAQNKGESIGTFSTPNLPDAFAKLDKALENSDQKQLQELTFKMINDDIVAPCEKAGIDDASARINKAKDLLSLEDEQFNIVTLSNVEGKTLVQAEVGLRDLTDQQREGYEKVQNDLEPYPKWFTVLPGWHQALVKKEIKQILNGKILSSQCSYLPGLRNIFEKTTGIIDDKGAIKTLNTVKHGGHMHAFSEDSKSNDYLRDMNAKQLQEWCGYDTSLHAVVLNTEFFLDKFDKKIVTSSRQKAMEHHWDITHAPLNIFRKITSSDHSAAINLINYVAGKTENDVIKNYLSSQSKYNKESLDKALKDDSENDPAVLRSAIDLKKGLDDRTYFDSNKDNLSIAAYTTNLVSNLDQAAKTGSDSKFADFPSTAGFIACKSGKDRTGVALLEITAKALADECGIGLAHARNLVINTYHQQMLSGSPNGGGSIGAYGLKKVPTSYGNPSELFPPTTSGNNIPTKGLIQKGLKMLSNPVKASENTNGVAR
ncbi:MAG: hypothetical protein EB127_14205 [Alphaproteobacteria bacterium]|nr:hypothetical protein [Alphaproteobacteria bacterium]